MRQADRQSVSRNSRPGAGRRSGRRWRRFVGVARCVPYVFPTRRIEGQTTPPSPTGECLARAKSPANRALINPSDEGSSPSRPMRALVLAGQGSNLVPIRKEAVAVGRRRLGTLANRRELAHAAHLVPGTRGQDGGRCGELARAVRRTRTVDAVLTMK